jgi:hypothetical protein
MLSKYATVGGTKCGIVGASGLLETNALLVTKSRTE